MRIIEECHAALAIPKNFRPKPGATVVAGAAAILAKLKAQEQGNKILATINIEDAATSWWVLLDAMETANQFLIRRHRTKTQSSDEQPVSWEDLCTRLHVG